MMGGWIASSHYYNSRGTTRSGTAPRHKSNNSPSTKGDTDPKGIQDALMR